MSKKLFKPQFVLGTMVPGILMYDQCSKRKKKNKRPTIKKWVSREIVFKENMNDIERAEVINETEKQMLQYLYQQNTPGCTIRSIRFFLKTGINYNYMQILGKVVFYYAKEGTDTGEKDPKKPVG
jgi:hypothetical protein